MHIGNITATGVSLFIQAARIVPTSILYTGVRMALKRSYSHQGARPATSLALPRQTLVASAVESLRKRILRGEFMDWTVLSSIHRSRCCLA
jgi:hypothetical protein